MRHVPCAHYLPEHLQTLSPLGFLGRGSLPRQFFQRYFLVTVALLDFCVVLPGALFPSWGLLIAGLSLTALVALLLAAPLWDSALGVREYRRQQPHARRHEEALRADPSAKALLMSYVRTDDPRERQQLQEAYAQERERLQLAQQQAEEDVLAAMEEQWHSAEEPPEEWS